MSRIENIDNLGSQKAILQVVMELLFLGYGNFNFEEDYDENLLEYFNVNKKGVREIKECINAIYVATGFEGIAEKYGFVVEVEHEAVPVQNKAFLTYDGSDICEACADLVSNNEYVVLKDYLAIKENSNVILISKIDGSKKSLNIQIAGMDKLYGSCNHLCIERFGNNELVIIENKLDDTGRDVVWQSLKYASYCSSLGKEEIKSIFQEYINKKGEEKSAETIISDFFEQEYEEIILNKGTSQRIILVAAKFRKEVTSTVLWLMNYNLKVQCFKVTPYQNGKELLLDIEQIIPVRDAEEYTIKIAEKSKGDSIAEAQLITRHQIREKLWSELLKEINSKSSLFRNISPGKDNWIGVGAGISGVAYNFVVTKNGARVELYIRNSNKEKNKEIFDYLHAKKDVIENSFGSTLEWSRLYDKDASRIYFSINGNYFEKEAWPNLIDSMSKNMIEFHKNISIHLKEFK